MDSLIISLHGNVNNSKFIKKNSTEFRPAPPPLRGFELFADGKGLIIEHLLDTATVEAVQRQHTVRQLRRALLLHSAGADVQDIFLTLTETDDRREYDVEVTALNNIISCQR